MTERSQQKKSRIPDFKSRQEMAEWWDTHEVADYLDELKPVIPVRNPWHQVYLM